MNETIPTRINLEQKKTIEDAAEKRGVTFQYLLRRVIKVGIIMMRLAKEGETD